MRPPRALTSTSAPARRSVGRVGALVTALLVALVVPLLAALSPGPLAGPAAADTYHPEWGSVSGQNGVLRKGCHTYYYSYALTPPPGQWALELFVTGPAGESVANDAKLDGSDPSSGQGHFRLCRPSTPFGTFTIQAKFSVDGDGTLGHQEGYLQPATFVLTKPVRKKPIWFLGPVRHHHR